jgi:hypothetical protein
MYAPRPRSADTLSVISGARLCGNGPEIDVLAIPPWANLL